MSPDVGGKKPEIVLKNVVLPAPLGPMIARSSPVATVMRDVLHRAQAAEMLRHIAHFQHGGHCAPLRWKMPSKPRGKNSTTSTKINPTKLIQFTVMEEM